jgi:hypothetical protein
LLVSSDAPLQGTLASITAPTDPQPVRLVRGEPPCSRNATIAIFIRAPRPGSAIARAAYAHPVRRITAARCA